MKNFGQMYITVVENLVPLFRYWNVKSTDPNSCRYYDIIVVLQRGTTWTSFLIQSYSKNRIGQFEYLKMGFKKTRKRGYEAIIAYTLVYFIAFLAMKIAVFI